jgi:hypothetical protein
MEDGGAEGRGEGEKVKGMKVKGREEGGGACGAKVKGMKVKGREEGGGACGEKASAFVPFGGTTARQGEGAARQLKLDGARERVRSAEARRWSSCRATWPAV